MTRLDRQLRNPPPATFDDLTARAAMRFLDDGDLAALVRDEEGRFRVDGRIHTDPTIFGLELQRIFGRVWTYVGQESEVAEPNDYRTTVLGVQPVIMSRSEDGEIHVILNRCSHRGAVACRDERGNANHFRCAYHNWVFRSDGSLIGMAQRSGYGEEFDTSGLDLLRVPRVEAYRGLVVATFDVDAPALVERLGPSARYVDLWAERSPGVMAEARGSKSGMVMPTPVGMTIPIPQSGAHARCEGRGV